MTNKRTVYGKKLLTAAVLVSMLPGGLAFAEEALPLYTLDAVVVTATRTENDVKNVPASTQIITSSDIKKSGATNVRDAITDFANITMTKKVRGGGHEIIVRGMSTDKSLIMVNGHRVANEADGSGLGNANALDRINVDNIEKIEIVKGPSSALYGSEAMGGVINIITKGSKEAEVRTGLVNSSEDFTNWWHLDSGEIGKFSATLDMRFNKIRRDGDDTDFLSDSFGTAQTYNFNANYHFNDHNYLNFYVDHYTQNLKRDLYNKKLFNAKAEFPDEMKDAMKARYGVEYVTGDASIDDGLANYHYKQQTYGLSWNGKTARNDWQIQTYLSKFDWQSDIFYSGLQTHGHIPAGQPSYMANMWDGMFKKFFTPSYANDVNVNSNKLFAIEARNSTRVNNNHRLTYGAEYVKNTVKGTNFGDDNQFGVTHIGSVSKNEVTKEISEKEIDTYAAYLQDEINYGKWFIVPAIRYDHHENFGSHTSPKLGLTYKANDTFRVKANYGKGFKAPTIQNLYCKLVTSMGQAGIITVNPNANLRPETSDSWDVGVEKEWGKISTSLVYFDTKLENMITTEKIGDHTHRCINVGNVRVKGIEHTLGYELNPMWKFKVNSTWLDAVNKDKNQPLPQRSRLSQIYSLSFDDGKDIGWSAVLWDELNYKYVTPVTVKGNTEAGPKKTYNLLNFTLTRKINKDTKIYGSVQNIFDKVDSDCDLDGRYWSLGWEHKF
ncbi:MAG: TonB-dependent receptor [Dialister sp.]|nr:TonB-dependent receptor [Dialister sp.]MDD6957958.1 TonB-dependent receptor [Dialister sp.]MDY4957119.1 TonB-dependent receptor [Dialister sp.]MDY6114953.1 TonB-dependent receptor [Dialister sp.]